MPDFGIFRGFNDKLFGNKLYAGQLPTQLGTIGSVSLYDADALTFFDRVTTAGGTLSDTEKNAVNKLVLDLKSYSIWSKMKAVYPMVGSSSAACRQNLKSSSFTGTFTSGWTFASTGATPNGTSAYMDTGFIESIDSTLNNQHLSVYLRTSNTGLLCDIGAESNAGANQSNIYPNFNSRFYPRIQASNGGIVQSLVTQGWFLSNRIVSSEVQGWKNNTKYTLSSASVGLCTNSIHLASANIGISGSNYSNRQNAFASIGEGLTDTEASNFYTAVQAFQTTLSRNV